jgi:hypothetical protein
LLEEFLVMEHEAIATLLETARRKFLETQEHFVGYMTKQGEFRGLSRWLDGEGSEAVKEAVNHSVVGHDVDTPDVRRLLTASLRFRVLAGTLTLPVTYHQQEPDLPGECGRLEFQDDRGCWDCVLPNSGRQRTADAWHQHYGYSPACPFWQNPTPENVEEKKTELEKAREEAQDFDLFAEEKRLLRTYQKRGI